MFNNKDTNEFDDLETLLWETMVTESVVGYEAEEEKADPRNKARVVAYAPPPGTLP